MYEQFYFHNILAFKTNEYSLLKKHQQHLIFLLKFLGDKKRVGMRVFLYPAF